MAVPSPAPPISVLPQPGMRGDPRAEFVAKFNAFFPALVKMTNELVALRAWMQTTHNSFYSEYTAASSALNALQATITGLQAAMAGLQTSDSIQNNRLTANENAVSGLNARQQAVETLLGDTLPALDVAAAEQAEIERGFMAIGNANRHLDLGDRVAALETQVVKLVDALNYLSTRTLSGAHVYK